MRVLEAARNETVGSLVPFFMSFLADFVLRRTETGLLSQLPLIRLSGAATSLPASDTTPPFASGHPRRCGVVPTLGP